MMFAIDWPLFLSTFGLIFVAELPDKTAFACLLMGARSHPVAVFLGVAAAFTIQSLVSVLAGQLISLAPERWVHLAAGILFLVFAFFVWREKDQDPEAAENPGALYFWKTVWSSFAVIFIAEWGDLTQLATATLQAKYHSGATIFLAATAALWTVSAIGIALGRLFQARVHPRILNSVAAVVFAMVGSYFLFESWRAG